MSETLHAIAPKAFLDKLDLYEAEKYVELNANVLDDGTQAFSDEMKNQIDFLVEFAEKVERRNKRNMKRREAKNKDKVDKEGDRSNSKGATRESA
jgi:ATP adenylyltransferase/5',5'''-P-1,P-4-tetraphosphate phosphorylase II